VAGQGQRPIGLSQQAGDQVAGDDEEDVHAHVTAGQERDAGVGGHHEEHRDRAKTLDVRAERAARQDRGGQRVALTG